MTADWPVVVTEFPEKAVPDDALRSVFNHLESLMTEAKRVAFAGGATVTPSTLLRGVITALFWLQPSPTPFFCLATRHDAMNKGIEMLQAAKVLLSPRLIAYRDKGRVRAVG